MRAATGPESRDGRLLVLDSRCGTTRHARLRELGSFLETGDLVVVNDAATFPASLSARTEGGAEIELRLLPNPTQSELWPAVLFGAGNWKTRTENRPSPPALAVGNKLFVGPDHKTEVEIGKVDAQSDRVVGLRFAFSLAQVWKTIYRFGKPVQYSYLNDELALWSVQTQYASRPWASEMPSAGRPLKWSLLGALRARGVEVVALTHATGLSSTGDPSLDSLLPFAESYELPEKTVRQVLKTRRHGGRVLGIGTSVVRALEGSAIQNGGNPIAGPGITNLKIGPGFVPRVVDAILTGVHVAGETHFDLLQAFVAEKTLQEAAAEAERLGYLAHEFGDSMLILPQHR